MPNKKFYQANKERLRQEAAEYYKKNRERIIARTREYQKANKSKYAELSLKKLHSDMKNSPEYLIYRRTKSRAKSGGIPFDLEPSDIVIPEYCPILGIKLKFGDKMTAPSIDKLVPDKGYTKGNIAIISGRANTIKNCGTAAEHRAIADWMESKGLT